MISFEEIQKHFFFEVIKHSTSFQLLNHQSQVEIKSVFYSNLWYNILNIEKLILFC
jgi:hypothetical protein